MYGCGVSGLGQVTIVVFVVAKLGGCLCRYIECQDICPNSTKGWLKEVRWNDLSAGVMVQGMSAILVETQELLIAA